MPRRAARSIDSSDLTFDTTKNLFRSETFVMAGTSLTREFWQFMRVRKKLWLLPIILMLVVVGALLVLAQGSALAPFIYTIF